MRFFLILLSICAAMGALNMHKYLAEISIPLQNFCVSSVANSPHADLQKALICGVNLPADSDWLQVLVRTGLIHLIVVSGSHLIVIIFLIEWLCTQNKYAKFWLWLILPIYTLMTGVQAPAVRALFSLLLSEFSVFFRLNMGRLQILIYSILLSFALAPGWCNSLSLILSASASLGLMALPQTTLFARQCLIFLLLLPPLAALQTFHPVHIFSNLILGPLLSLVLLPAAALGLLPLFLPLFLGLANCTFKVLQWLTPLTPAWGTFSPTPHLLLWTFWLALWIYFDHRQRRHRRRHWQF